ncbi:MAG: ion transporter, partial [Raoultibacter sp.]
MSDHTSDKLASASSLKLHVFYAVEDPRKGGAVARVFGTLIFALIIANAFLIFIEYQPGLPDWAYLAMYVFGIISAVCFGIEYCARLWVADLVRPEMPSRRARMRYAFSIMGIIDLLAFLPVAVALFIPLSPAAITSVRIIRLVRLIKVSRYMKGLQSISRVFHTRKHEIVAAFMVLALLTVTASVLMFQVENPVQPEAFDSVFTGMYWAMTTITSTGYGDLVPIMAAGRFIGFCTMLLSIGVVAIPAGI